MLFLFLIKRSNRERPDKIILTNGYEPVTNGINAEL